MATFLLEIGTEEMPASFLPSALAQLEAQAGKSLQEAQLSGTVRGYATPRRLSLLISGLPTTQTDRETEIKGPPARVAFGADGKPTVQAEGFARKAGVALADLYVRPTDKGEVVFARQQVRGLATGEVLSACVPGWITGIEGPRLMRWGAGELRFSRPIRWLVALLDAEVLPVEIAGVQSGRTSYGHRVLCPGAIEISTADSYLQILRDAFVMVDPRERAQVIEAGVKQLADEAQAQAEMPEKLLEEVNFLVEWPTAVLGHFDREFLELPAAVIKTEMISHQRYFPLHQAGSPETLLPMFITISNGDPQYAQIISQGNGRVIRARLADGRFFFEEDRKRPLSAFLPKLSTVTFQENLGSVGERVERIEAIAAWLCRHLEIDKTDLVLRTAHLCKADLTTQMVYEFPELQGIMGRYYALLDGEDPEVAAGIAEHYQPRTLDDDLPASLTGQVVGLADRLDVLVGLFGLGMLPTGSSDPFALRRAALAVVRISWDTDFRLDLVQAIGAVLDLYHERKLLKQPRTTVESQLYDWFAQRLQGLLVERDGLDYDLVNAILGQDGRDARTALADLRSMRLRLDALAKARATGQLAEVYETAVRVARLAAKADIRDWDLQHYDCQLSESPAETALHEAVTAFAEQAPALENRGDYLGILTALARLTPEVSTFFDKVMVMVEDEHVRKNRLRLLAVIDNNVRRFFDVTQVVPAGSQQALF